MESSVLHGLRRSASNNSLQRLRKFEGALDGSILAGWLNLFGHTPAGLEVTALLRDLQTLMDIWPKYRFNPYVMIRDEAQRGLQQLLAIWPNVAGRRRAALRLGKAEAEREYHEMLAPSSAALRTGTEKHRAVLAELSKIPKKVRSKWAENEGNILMRSIDERLRTLFEPPSFEGFRTDGGRKRIRFGRAAKPRFEYAELIADPLYRLGELGLLDRVRRCPSCGVWLFAKVERERFCSAPCREKEFRTSPTGRAKRRKYMRNYRAGLKRMDRNYRELAHSAKGAK